MEKRNWGIDLKALIRENLLFMFGLPFKVGDDISRRIIEQCQDVGWIEVVGDSSHVLFERTWSKEM